MEGAIFIAGNLDLFISILVWQEDVYLVLVTALKVYSVQTKILELNMM